MTMSVISVGEERDANRCTLISHFERKKDKLCKTMTFLKVIARFSKNVINMIISCLNKSKTHFGYLQSLEQKK